MPAKIIGDITWVPQPGYPELTGEEGNEKITHKFIGSFAKLADNLPAYGVAFYDERYPFFSKFDKLQLTSRTVKTKEGGKHAEITLVYSIPSADEYDEQGVMMEVEYQAREMDISLEEKSNYFAHWNHRLFAKNGVTEVPDWWANAKTTELSEALSEKYQWLKPGDSKPTGWHELLVNTKKSENFRIFPCEVIMIKRSVDKKELQRIAKLDGTKQTPPDTFDVSGEWLQGASGLRKEGKFWVLRVPYINSKEIDPELYD